MTAHSERAYALSGRDYITTLHLLLTNEANIIKYLNMKK